MEALSVFEGEARRHRGRQDALAQQHGEVRRNLVSPIASALSSHLALALEDGDRLHEQFKSRLYQALEILGSVAELIHPTPGILLDSLSSDRIDAPTDNLILACILDHARLHPSETKLFVSENRRDFDANVRARLALRGAGVRYFADASKCLEWLRAYPES